MMVKNIICSKSAHWHRFAANIHNVPQLAKALVHQSLIFCRSYNITHELK